MCYLTNVSNENTKQHKYIWPTTAFGNFNANNAQALRKMSQAKITERKRAKLMNYSKNEKENDEDQAFRTRASRIQT